MDSIQKNYKKLNQEIQELNAKIEKFNNQNEEDKFIASLYKGNNSDNLFDEEIERLYWEIKVREIKIQNLKHRLEKCHRIRSDLQSIIRDEE